MMDIENLDMAILSEIEKSRFPVGSKYLSSQLNIPPATIGRILRHLEDETLIEKASNKGRIISENGKKHLMEENARINRLKTVDNLINMVEDSSKDNLIEILDVRKLLEGKGIELACKRATDEQIRELENILFEYEYAIRHGGLGNIKDYQLHTTIAKISGNATIYHLLDIILTQDNAYTKFSISADHIMNVQLEQHKIIVQSIQKRDPDAARAAMENHLNQVISDVKKYHK